MAGKTETYHIAKNAADERVTLSLSVPLLQADNLSLITWGSSFILSGILYRLRESVPVVASDGPVSILELGAGTGLVGLSAAVVWGADVILTDLEPIIPGLVANATLNAEAIAAHGGRVLCGTLDWNQPEQLLIHSDDSNDTRGIVNDSEHNKASVVMAADTMYWEEHPRLISQTIFAWLKRNKDARAVVCYSLRIAYLEVAQEFYERMEHGGMELVAEGREEMQNDDWDDEKLYEWNVWRWKESEWRS
ncbi:hypothetical protein EXIGLDRAFT_726829 [Exidia glandulosa HHB12029]|uniref:Uncharacterized protein n=1 Tax=Exidia glandulosa HHB12029 TaxID=1314781 RepID=A0A165M983_EXIGL|nr:hypothetical protein EXIGLDRAFT_726829 [Exidia glandulosa HHB12029]